MLTGTLWPAHPHPYNGECLSSWLIRCSHANGLKAQTFCHQEFPGHEIWNRDIDRLAPDWLLEQMALKTGITLKRATQTSFRLFEGRLFPLLHAASQLRWMTPVKMHHRTYTGFGMQYCPLCLTAEEETFYRLGWRCAMYTFCPKHQCLLHDRCHQCQQPVMFHRIELGNPQMLEVETLDCCWYCGTRLSKAPIVKVKRWHDGTFRLWENALKAIDKRFINAGPVNYQRLALVHQICRLNLSKTLAPKLHSYLCGRTKLPQHEPQRDWPSFEQYSLIERHHVLQLAWWLAERPKLKITTAISSRALKGHELYRDQPTLRALCSRLDISKPD